MKTLSIHILQSENEYLSRLSLDVEGNYEVFHSFKEIDEALFNAAFRRIPDVFGSDMTNILIMYGDAEYMHSFDLRDFDFYGLNDIAIDLLQDLKRTLRARVRVTS